MEGDGGVDGAGGAAGGGGDIVLVQQDEQAPEIPGSSNDVVLTSCLPRKKKNLGFASVYCVVYRGKLPLSASGTHALPHLNWLDSSTFLSRHQAKVTSSMAMVLDAFASYVADMVKQVAEDQVGMMLGVFGEIDKMGDKLQDLQNFLADADRRNITDERVREWVGQLKCAMYEATDILDLCHLKAMERGSSSFDAGCFNPLLFCRRNPSHAHEIGTRIKALNKRLDSIKERSAAFSFINLVSYEDRHSSKVHASSHGNPGHETSGDLDRSSVVGEKIEEDTRALVAQILQTRNEVNNNIMVIAIVGVGGIGKTTLAQKVFNDEAIQGNFSKKIWLSVNQNLSDVELLRRAITEVGGDHLLAGDAKVALNRTLKDALIGHKTLLVMDDVWDHGAWEGVLKIPLFNAAASYSRVIITTRDEGVARRMRATWPYHHVDTLTPDDAWSLLKKQVSMQSNTTVLISIV
ncbi:hypothetical protein ACQ4PT_049209 [Festuca glaucescens]